MGRGGREISLHGDVPLREKLLDAFSTKMVFLERAGQDYVVDAEVRAGCLRKQEERAQCLRRSPAEAAAYLAEKGADAATVERELAAALKLENAMNALRWIEHASGGEKPAKYTLTGDIS